MHRIRIKHARDLAPPSFQYIRMELSKSKLSLYTFAGLVYLHLYLSSPAEGKLDRESQLLTQQVWKAGQVEPPSFTLTKQLYVDGEPINVHLWNV